MTFATCDVMCGSSNQDEMLIATWTPARLQYLLITACSPPPKEREKKKTGPELLSQPLWLPLSDVEPVPTV